MPEPRAYVIEESGEVADAPPYARSISLYGATAGGEAPVTSVAGKTGDVTLAVADIATLQATLTDLESRLADLEGGGGA